MGEAGGPERRSPIGRRSRPPLDAILPGEKDAVIRYALAHPKDGYRRLAWQMIDANVAYLSPSSSVSRAERRRPALSLETEYVRGGGAGEAHATA